MNIDQTFKNNAALIDLAGGSALEIPYDRFRDVFLRQLPRRNGEGQELFAVLDESGAIIGRIGLFGFDDRRLSAELGIVIGERNRWGNGYGREAVRTLTSYGFGALGLERIYLYTFEDNMRAQRTFLACGFGRLRQVRRFSFDRGIHTEVEMEMRGQGAPDPDASLSPGTAE